MSTTLMPETKLFQTPLHDEHCALKARIVPFAGWQMPLQYEGILTEYDAARKSCTIFDTSHMGEFFIDGDCLKSGFDSIVTLKLNDMPLKSCRYGLMLNERGGIIDDLIVYRIEQEKWMIVVNAAHIEKKAAWFQQHLNSNGRFKNASFETGKLDIQGPLARDVLKPLVNGIEKLEYYHFDYFDCLGERVIVSRTGYTGELGYEIYFPWTKTKELWKTILKNDKVKPAGLGVRDVLRLEMGYCLYGQDLTEETSPLEAGLSRFIDFDKDFVGKEALLKQKENGDVKQKFICFASDSRRAPRSHYKIWQPDGTQIGEVTSGTFSPSLKKGIGMGFVLQAAAAKGADILWGDGKNKFPGIISPRPFYKNGSLKN